MSQNTRRLLRRPWAIPTATAAVIGLVAAPTAFAASHHHDGGDHTATPIKHVVVLFQENVSYDHYFGTYPKAANTDGTPFTAKKDTPTGNGLTSALLTANPNQYNPTRLAATQALTCDQNHGYTAEQKAADNGLQDKYVQFTNVSTCTGMPVLFGTPGLVMDYYDGNTVTGLWNYAQNYAMSDNSYSDVFGPSTPGALNLISGQTYGAKAVDSVTGATVSAGFIGAPNANGVGTLFTDADPAFDNCADSNHTSTSPLAALSGKNIGDLLNAKNVTWGWFQGGFTPTGTNAAGYSVCGSTHTNIGGNSSNDYNPHHEPFQYFQSTANPKHLPPSSPAAIGHTDQANHQYDLTSFTTALNNGNLPAVSFLKAANYQDGHAGYSDPLDEQKFLATEINAIQQSPEWGSTAIVIAYDDSDGWYDHATGTIVNGSSTALDASTQCTGATAVNGQADRCGVGPRQPLLVISPFSKQNYISHTMTTQASILQFVENNWKTGRIGNGSFDATAGSLNGLFNFDDRDASNRVILNPATGAIVWSKN
jgi:phospholipase C